jgi:hypothetical protein
VPCLIFPEYSKSTATTETSPKPSKLPPNPHPTMEDFLSKLDQLIAEQDLSVIEVIGALELTKAELMADVLDDEGESID